MCIQHILGRGAAANIGAGYKVNALGLHNVYAAVNDLLFQLHVGDAVHQQAAHAVLTLVYGHFVAALVQVIGNRKAGRAGTYHGNGFAGAGRGRAGGQQAGFIAIFYNGVLVLLHGNRAAGGVAAGAGSFAQSGAYPAGKLREAVGGAQAMYSQIPLALVDQVVPFGNQVVQRAAACHAANHHASLAERYAAIHAAGTLRLLFILRQRDVKFVKVLNAFFRRQLRAGLPGNFHKSCRFSHRLRLPYLLAAFFIA